MVIIGLFCMLYYWTLCRIGAEAEEREGRGLSDED